jgi:hypothetical protein
MGGGDDDDDDYYYYYYYRHCSSVSRDSSVGIATGYGLNDQGWQEFESR